MLFQSSRKEPMVAQTRMYIGKTVEDIIKKGTKREPWSLNSMGKKVKIGVSPWRVREVLGSKDQKSPKGLRIGCERYGSDHCDRVWHSECSV